MKLTCYLRWYLDLINSICKGGFIVHVIYVAGTRIIEAVIDGLLIGNNLGVIMRVVYLLNFIPLHLVSLQCPVGLDSCIKYLWVSVL